MCGEWLFIINVALMSIYRYTGVGKMALCTNILLRKCRFIAINVW